MEQGVIRVPLAPIRSAPDDRAEMVTQGLFGEPLQWSPAKDASGWIEVQLETDGYRGFTDAKLVATDQDSIAAFAGEVNILTEPLTRIDWNGRDHHLPAGARVPVGILPPQGNGDTCPVQAAAAFLGAPYLWGGKSVLGMDCSGLTQLASAICGEALPRDASDQWGSLQQTGIAFDDLRHGDLVFFHKEQPEKVTHVGFAWQPTGEPMQVLHASGEVRIDALTAEGIVRDGTLTHRWTGAAHWPVSVG